MEEKELENMQGNLMDQVKRLEQQRIDAAKQEIEAVCRKYGVKLEGYVMLPATQIRIVPDRE